MPKIKTSKEELIELCYKTFKSTGYPTASIATLATACNVEKAHLYYYFKNKEDIMLEVLQYIKNKVETEVFSIAYEEELEFSQRLNALLEKLKNFYKEVEIGCLMTNTVIQTLYGNDNYAKLTQDFISKLTHAIAHLYQDRYSANYAIGKAEQAVQDLYGGLIFAQIYKDDSYLEKALNRVKKKL